MRLTACPEALEGEGLFAALRDSAARFLSANGMNKRNTFLRGHFTLLFPDL